MLNIIYSNFINEIISFSFSGSGLFKRAILMSGSSLSPWAIVKEPAKYASQAAKQLGCDMKDTIHLGRSLENLLHCMRNKSIHQILQVNDCKKFSFKFYRIFLVLIFEK